MSPREHSGKISLKFAQYSISPRTNQTRKQVELDGLFQISNCLGVGIQLGKDIHNSIKDVVVRVLLDEYWVFTIKHSCR